MLQIASQGGTASVLERFRRACAMAAGIAT